MNRSRENDGGSPRGLGRPHLEDYWRVVWRRGWLILLVSGVAVAAAAWAATRRPQLYQASLTLQVGDPRGRGGRLGDLNVSSNWLWTDPIQSEVQQLTTQAVAEYVVDSLALRVRVYRVPRHRLLAELTVDPGARVGDYRLVVAPEGTVTVAGEPDGPSATGRVGAALAVAGLRLVVRPEAEPGTYELGVLPEQAARARVSGGLAASPRPETNLIDVTYTDSDPVLATDILNTVAEAARALGVRRARSWARSRTQFINDQLEASGRDLQRALESVEAYKERRGLTSLSSEESRLLRRLGDLQAQLEQLVIERSLYRRLIERTGEQRIRPQQVQQLALMSSSSTNRAVQFYIDRLLTLLEERAAELGRTGKDPAHPEIKAFDERIAETQQRLVAAAENAAAALDARIGVISQTLGSLQQELRRLPAVETELARLQNQVDIHTEMYKYLLSKYQEAQIAEAEIAPYLEVVDSATWARPVGGGRWTNVLFGALVGLLLGVSAAFFLEYLDRSVQSTADIESGLGLAVLGWIPRMETGALGRPFPLVTLEEPGSPAAETYRVLRTNLAFSSARETQLITLLFTSPGPGEGKSTTASNLAPVLADRGDRTLLVDADLRRGRIHEAFDLLRSPGLTDLLVGQVDLREAIRPDVRPGLDVLPTGQRPPNPSELLGSEAMAELLDSWREEYRWVLIDAPPVLAVTDSAVLGAMCDGTVLVLKAGVTDQRAAWRAVQQLDRVDARVIGSVLNELRPSRSPEDYYLDYYTAYSRTGARVREPAVPTTG